MYNKKIIDYPENCKNKIERHRYTARTIDIHLNTSSAENIKGEWIKRYCDFFGCSADYLFGYIDAPSHSITNIENETGLSIDAVQHILNYKKMFPRYIESLDFLLCSDNFSGVLYHLHKYVKSVNLYIGFSQKRCNRQMDFFSSTRTEENGSYNYPHNDSLEQQYKKAEADMNIEEYKLDTNFRYIIREIYRKNIQKKQ